MSCKSCIIIIIVSKFLLWSLHHFSNAAWGCVWIFRLFWTTSVPPQRRNSTKQQQHWSSPTHFQLRYTWPSLKVQSRHIKMPLYLSGARGDAFWSWDWEENMRQSPVRHCRASRWPNFEKARILWITSTQQKPNICQNAAVVGEPRAEGQTLDGQTCCQTLFSPERNIRSNTAHKKDFFLSAVRWQFAFSSPTWRHCSAVICHSPCVCVRSLFAQMGCQRSVARWITLHVKPHRRRGSFRTEMLIFFGL